jgi:nicotinate-nucleotide--dimethylbenzimidazole phosphoribosyltransferase
MLCMNLNMLTNIKPVDEAAAKDCIARFDQVAKPVGSLGKLEELLARIASVTGSAEIDISSKAVAVFCADNGVTQKGVAQGGHEVTTAIAGMLGIKRASVSVMAKTCGAAVFNIDIGMVDTVEGLRDRKLSAGTGDITEGPAMSRETAEKAISIGIETVKELKDLGFRLIAAGEAGIGNTTTASAICSVLLNRSVSEVTGRGAGLDDAGLCRKIAAIEQAITVNQPNPSDSIDTLCKLGGLDIAAMAGLFFGGALYRVPIVMDGFISGAAALVAIRQCPDVLGYIIPSHESGEPGARFLMEELKFSPVIQAEMRLGEGTGAVALFALLDMALAVYRDAATFADIQVHQYKREA